MVEYSLSTYHVMNKEHLSERVCLVPPSTPYCWVFRILPVSVCHKIMLQWTSVQLLSVCSYFLKANFYKENCWLKRSVFSGLSVFPQIACRFVSVDTPPKSWGHSHSLASVPTPVRLLLFCTMSFRISLWLNCCYLWWMPSLLWWSGFVFLLVVLLWHDLRTL